MTLSVDEPRSVYDSLRRSVVACQRLHEGIERSDMIRDLRKPGSWFYSG